MNQDETTVLYSRLANADTPDERLDRLRQHQNKEARATKERLAQLAGIREDYEALKSRLQTVTDKTSHEIMVPFTKVAYFPGKLVHTNEITCLLGDNWFVERSAKQAVEIVDRRLKMCHESIKKIEDGMKLLNSWKEQTEKFRNDLKVTQGVNIVEEENDDSWREVHRQKVREYKQKLAELRNKEEPTAKEQTFDDIMRMLDERELEEDLRDELAMLDEEYDESGDEEEEEDGQEPTEEVDEQRVRDELEHVVEEVDEQRVQDKVQHVVEEAEEEKKKSVRWSEELDNVKQFKRNELIVKSPSDGVLKLTFTHTKERKQRKARFADDQNDNDDDNEQRQLASEIVKSPAEIFSKYGAGAGSCAEFAQSFAAADEPKKSILKVKKSTTPVLTDKLQRFDDDDDGGPDARQQQTHRVGAIGAGPPPVGDEVKEREANVPEPAANTHRPLSRFKAARQHKKL